LLKKLLKATRPDNQGALLENLIGLCEALAADHSDLDDLTLVNDALAIYARLSGPSRIVFFEHLASTLGPDPGEIARLARRFAHSEAPKDLIALRAAMESPRTELLRRLNRAPTGIQTIVQMRAELLKLHQHSPQLGALSDEIRTLLRLWFDPGFLRLARVDWQSPAALLDQLIQFEAVHPMDGWSDLRRRLDTDRRCYAFFHPVMPETVLFFIEVALLESMPEDIASLLDRRKTTAKKSERFPVAAFYSMSNCQPGLRGVRLGSSLIRQVLFALHEELPDLNQFCTLSPVPGFSTWLASTRTLESKTLKPAMLEQLNQDLLALRKRFGSALEALCERDAVSQQVRRGPDRSSAAVRSLADPVLHKRRQEDRADGQAEKHTDTTGQRNAQEYEQLRRLCAFYLLEARAGMSRIIDDEARFHLRNGASLEQINVGANLSKNGLEQSYGMMVNYCYRLKDLDRNHQAALRGEVVASRQVSGLLRSLRVVR